MSIQQSVNQLLGSASIMAGLYAHSPMGQRKFRLKDLDNQGTRAMDRIIGHGEDIENLSPEAFADLQERVKEYNEISAEYAKLTPDLDDALDLDKQRIGITEEINKKIKAREQRNQHSGLNNAVQVGTEQLQSQLTTQDYIDGILNKAKDTPGFGSRKMKKLKKQLKRLEDDE